MQWSCPHCGVKLAVSDDRLGSGWSFSRCYKCAGFALVRRSDVNLIKVDKAPAGEQVLLPEATEEPIMTRDAADRLAQHMISKPTIKPTSRRTPVSPNTASLAEAAEELGLMAPKNTATPQKSIPQKTEVVGTSVSASSLPEPLPEAPRRSLPYRALPVAIGLAAITTVGSGIYLFNQGQALWQKARTTNAAVPIIPSQPAATVNAEVSMSKTEALAEMTDQVHHNAMAPAREEIAPPAVARAAPAAAPAAPKGLTVAVLSPSAHLHSGPGLDFPIIGVANPEYRYRVTEWKDRWFKISIPGPVAQAWIRNDLVQISSQ